MELYNYFRSSTSYRARIALALKEIPYEYRPVHLLKKEQYAADFLKVNPQGELPALVVDGKALAQSLAILEYLEEIKPSPSIYPGDAFHRGRIRQFCENINSYLHPLTNLKVQSYLADKHGYDQAAKEEWTKHWYIPGFEVLERLLREHSGDWCFGNEITAADICLIPAVFSARRFNVPLAAFPLVEKIERRAESHPAFRQAHPFRQPDTPPEMRVP